MNSTNFNVSLFRVLVSSNLTSLPSLHVPLVLYAEEASAALRLPSLADAGFDGTWAFQCFDHGVIWMQLRHWQRCVISHVHLIHTASALPRFAQCGMKQRHQVFRFLGRAGDVCASISNGWWGGNQAMKESQIYPHSFGWAVLRLHEVCLAYLAV